jgi:tetratricopeptide (TPR) repeat protein
MAGEIGAADDKSPFQEALALHQAGHAIEAERTYLAVLQSDPGHREALHGLGVLCLQSGRPNAAIAYLQKAAAASGSTATIRNDLGVALCTAGRYAEAAEVYRELIRANPNDVSSHVNLGKLLNFTGAYPKALEVLKNAVRLAPDHAQAHNQLAMALAECRFPDEALAHFERAAAIDPKRSDYFCDWGSILLRLGRPQQAADCFRRALALASGSPASWCGLGEALGGLDRHAEAISCFEHAIALAPDFALAHYNRGTALAYLGRLAEAEKAFARAAELAPDNPAFRSAPIGLRKTAADNGNLKALEAMEASAGDLDANEEAALHFTLAKAYDDAGDCARAFEQLRHGNAARRSRSGYDIRRDLDRFRAIAEAFTADIIAAGAGERLLSELPVFVIGMPRSGTTLVEQIIASHSDAFGAGEQGILPGLVNAGLAGRAFPAAIGALDREAWLKLGAAYAERLRALSPSAARITDKLPLNFQLAGLIRLALPGARIVHVVRDPLDTCFSCYSTLFEDGDLDFTCDLTDLGRYYRGYMGMMDHWRAVLPQGAMLEVRYEKLVENLEPEARRLIGYCGLDWNERCLKFHETVRPVQTASALQVRQPLYNTSVGRASRYAQWLEPLRLALAGGAEN